MDEDYYEMEDLFPLVVFHRGVEISFLGVTGDGSDASFNRQELVQKLKQRDCESCVQEATTLLDWILQCGDDQQIGEWCCEQLDKSNAQNSIVSHSPKSGAVQVLFENFKCDKC